MPIYEYMGRIFDIPEGQEGKYEETHPEAKKMYNVGGDVVALSPSYQQRVNAAGGHAMGTDEYRNHKNHRRANPLSEDERARAKERVSAKLKYLPVNPLTPAGATEGYDAYGNPVPNVRTDVQAIPTAEEVEEKRKEADERATEAYRKALEEEKKKKGGWLRLIQGSADVMPQVYGTEERNAMGSRDVTMALATEKLLSDAGKIREQADMQRGGKTTFAGNVWRGVRDNILRPENWDFGNTDIKHLTLIEQAVEKAEKGKELTGEEESLMEAAAINALVSGAYADNVGSGYTVGGAVAESIPFMVEMAVNPISGATKSLAARTVRAVAKKIGKKGIATAASKVAGRVAAVPVLAGGAAGMTATTGIVGVGADAKERAMAGEDDVTAFAKAFGARTIENLTEMVGMTVRGLPAAAGKWAGKIPPVGKVRQGLQSISTSRMVRGVDDAVRKGGWDGMGEEYLEEVAGTILNSLTVGDSSMSELTDIDKQVETFMSVALMGGAISTARTGGYMTDRAKAWNAKRRLSKADGRCAEILPDWENVRERIDGGDMSVITDMVADKGMSAEQKKAVLTYLKERMRAEGSGMAERKQREEGIRREEYDRMEEAYRSGAEAQGEEKRKILSEMEAVKRKWGISEEKAEELDGVEDPVGYMDAHPQEREMLQEYFTAKERTDGLVDGVNARIADRGEQAGRAVDEITHEDGNVYAAQMQDGGNAHVIKGRVVMGEDGEIDRGKSDERYVVRGEDGTIRMVGVGEISTVAMQGRAEAVREEAVLQATEAARGEEADEIDGVTQWQVGVPMRVAGEDGTVGEITITAMNADGTYTVTDETGAGGVMTRDEIADATARGEETYGMGVRGEAVVDGNAVDAEIAGMADADGNIPVNIYDEDGNVVGMRNIPPDAFMPVMQETGNEPVREVQDREENVSTSDDLYRLSDEIDENGRQFVLNSNGSVEFGQIDEQSGLTPAPILLSEGLITNPATNDGYGLVHIEARHGEQIRNAGYDNVVSFIEEVVKNYEVIREGINRDGHQTYMLQLTDKHNNTLMVELSGDGSYWNINTAGIFKTSYGKNRKEVYNRHTTDKQPTETIGVSQGDEQSGTQSPSSMNTPTLSADKTTTEKPESQEGEEKNTELREGKSFTEERAKEMVNDMERMADVAPEVELTIENWDALFGEDGKVATPIGEVKMGENQFAKLMRQGRNGKLGMIKPTLETPHVVIEVESEAKEGDITQRGSSYVFVKSFKKNDGTRYYHFTSITVSKDGKEVVVSNQEKSRNRILRLLQEGNIIWYTPKDVAASSAERQGLDYEQSETAETAAKGSEITPQKTPSGNKNTSSEQKSQEGEEKISISKEKKGGKDVNLQGEKNTENGRTEDTNHATGMGEDEVSGGREIYQPVSQGDNRTQIEEIGFKEIAVRLRERIEAAERETQSGVSGTLRGTENRVTREYAQENGLWIPYTDIFKMGVPAKSGNEHDNFLNVEQGVIYKVNNRMNTPYIIDLLDRIARHNQTFPDTQYRLIGFTSVSNNGDVLPVFAQTYIDNSRMATTEEIDVYMGRIGFASAGGGRYSNGTIVVKDLYPRNVLIDIDGNVYVVDAEFEPAREVEDTADAEETANDELNELDYVLRGAEGAFDEIQKTQGEIKPTAKKRKGNIWIFTGKEKERPALMGVYHDPDGYAVASSAYILLVDKEAYSAENSGKVVDKNGNEIQGKFPKWQMVIPQNGLVDSGWDITALTEWIEGVKASIKAKKLTKREVENTRILLRTSGGKLISMYYENLYKFIDGVNQIGAKEILYAGLSTNPTLVAKNDRGVVLAAPMPVIDDYNATVANHSYAYDGKSKPKETQSKSQGNVGKAAKGNKVEKWNKDETITNDTQAKQMATEAVITALRSAGVEVIEATPEMVEDVTGKEELSHKKISAPDTASVQEEHQPTVVSSTDGANILKKIDNAIEEYENKGNTSKTFLGDAAQAIGARRYGSGSQYATFETVNGKVVTIRLSDHNATVSNFDNNGEKEGISIVITPKGNAGVINDGTAHVVEYFYDAIKLRRAEGKPLVEILKSIKQALYSGEYTDTTGLAEREEINAEIPQYHRVYHGSGSLFEEFDHSFMGTGEGQQAYGWGTYVTEVRSIGESYARSMAKDVYRNGKKIKVPSTLTTTLPIANIVAWYVEKYHRPENAMMYDMADSIRHNDTEMQELYKKALKEYRQNKWKTGGGNLYTVNIPDDKAGRYIDYKGSVGEKAVKKIADKLREIGFKHTGENRYVREGSKSNVDFIVLNSKATGADIYEELAYALEGQKNASSFLSMIGFKGISYPAQNRTGGREDGAKNYVIFNEKDLKIKSVVQLMQTPQGTVYGWTVGGKVYLTHEGMNPNTPIHEYTHLWANAMMQKNTKGWESVKNLLKGTPVWDAVMADKAYENIHNDENMAASEVLSRISGRENARKMETEAQKMIDEANGVTEKAKAVSLLSRMKEALQKFWNWVGKDLFGIENFGSVDEVTDRVLYDLVSGTDLTNGMNVEDDRVEMVYSSEFSEEEDDIRYREEDDEYTEEEQGIINRAKADGTYMKAPNGKPTKLTERQWVQVRTQAFKNWFGDWEKAAKIIDVVKVVKEHGFENFQAAKKWAKAHITGEYNNPEIGYVNISSTAVDKYLSQKAVEQSDNKNVHLSALQVMPLIIENSMAGEIHNDRNSNENIKDIVRLYGAIDIDGTIYRVKTTVKRYNDSHEKTKAYSYEVTEIELLEGTHGDANKPLPRTTNSSITGAKLLNGVENSKGEPILNSSKIVDKNGEPMVKEHSTWEEDFYAFDTERIGEASGDEGLYGAGLYFGNVGHTKLYGDRHIQVFLNMKNPLVLPKAPNLGFREYIVENFDKEGLRDIAAKYGQKTATMGAVIDAIKEVNANLKAGQYDELIEAMKQYWGTSAAEQVVSQKVFKMLGFPLQISLEPFIEKNIGRREFTEALRNAGYDGVIYDGKEYVVFNPNQIKSATDNTGAFSEDDNDIRYREEDDEYTRLSKQSVEKSFGGIWIEDKEEYAKFTASVNNYVHEEDGEGIAYTDNHFYAYYRNIDGEAIPFVDINLNVEESQDLVNNILNKYNGDIRRTIRQRFDRYIKGVRGNKSSGNVSNGNDNKTKTSRRVNGLVIDFLRKGRYFDSPSLYVKGKRTDRGEIDGDIRYRISTEDEELDNELGKALYTLNKEAKKYRDAKREYYDFGKTENVLSLLQEIGKIDGSFIIEGERLSLENSKGESYTSYNEVYDDIRYSESEIRYAESRLEEDEAEWIEDEDKLSEDEKEELRDEIEWQQNYIDELEDFKDLFWKVERFLSDRRNVYDAFSRKINELYELKNSVLNTLIPLGESDDLHVFPKGDARYMYKLGDYAFHGEDVSETISEEEYDSAERIEEISSENKLQNPMDVKDAVNLLRSYIDGVRYSYIDSSMSVNAALAREAGRAPETEFKKAYNMPKKTFDVLRHIYYRADEPSGDRFTGRYEKRLMSIIDSGEWHHTGPSYKKTFFFGWGDAEDTGKSVDYAIYKDHKKEIDRMAKEIYDSTPLYEVHEPNIVLDFFESKRDEYRDKAAILPNLYDHYGVPVVIKNRIYEKESLLIDAYEQAVPLKERRELNFYEWKKQNLPFVKEVMGEDADVYISERHISDLDEYRFRPDSIKQINDRFNAELQQQIDGTLPEGHIYKLGMPSDILLSAGVANVPIQLNPNRLKDKSMNFGHDYDLSEIKNLVVALNKPMAVFSYGDKNKAQNIVVEIQHEGKNFIVGISIRPEVNGTVLDINSIRNVFPKDNAEWLNWITQGKALYIDKEKIQTLIDQQRTNLADVEYLDLDSVTKIVEEFENPTLPEKNNIEKEKPLRESMREEAERVGRELGEDVVFVTAEQMPRGRGRAKGYYNPRTGKVIINLSAHRGVDDVKATVFHEVVGHKGLRGIMGEKFDAFLDGVYKGVGWRVRSGIDAAMQRYMQSGESEQNARRHATEEYMARMAEDGFSPRNITIWNRIADILRDVLMEVKIRLGFALSGRDVRYALWKSYEVQRGSAGVIAAARDMSMRMREGMTVRENDGTRYRDVEDVTAETLDIWYDNRVMSNGYKLREGYQDGMLALKDIQEKIAERTGRPIEDYEDAYTAENQMGSISQQEMYWYGKRYFNPMMEAVTEVMRWWDTRVCEA